MKRGKLKNKILWIIIVLILLAIIGSLLSEWGKSIAGNVIANRITCSDSDSGKEYNVQGITSAGTTSKTDYCLNDKKLKEYYCQAKKIKSVNIKCPGKGNCYQGICLLPDVGGGSSGGSSDECDPRCNYNGQEICKNINGMYSEGCVYDSTLNCYKTDGNLKYCNTGICYDGSGCQIVQPPQQNGCTSNAQCVQSYSLICGTNLVCNVGCTKGGQLPCSNSCPPDGTILPSLNCKCIDGSCV